MKWYNFFSISLILFLGVSQICIARDFNYYLSGSSSWVKTPYRAISGKHMILIAKGSVKHSWMSGWHTPDGNPNSFCGNACKLTSKCSVAALIMKIGKRGKVYCVGTLLSGKAPTSGDIYFAVNDIPPSDNEGGFDIILSGTGITIGGNTFD